MKPTSAKMKPEMINAIDELVRQKRYANRSEVIRMALRDLIRQYEGKY
ncbi:MAG: ribbon-helix-helix protein, CopG family [Methanobacteriota archaeon]|nr:MAG: ribbon-helix-helix protein, CopG family [Euryarchaeota archaeon]